MFENFVDVIDARREDESKGIVFISNSADKFVSYQELYKRSLEALGVIQRLTGNTCRELVFQVEDNETFITAFLACMLGKMIPVPLATGAENDCRTKLKMVWSQLESPFLLVDEKNLERCRQYCEQRKDNEFFEGLTARLITEASLNDNPLTGLRSEVSAADIAFVQYSSGSTGSPKGSMVTHANLMTNVHDMIRRAEISEADRSISWLPLTHDFGLICAFLTNMTAGITQFMMLPQLFVRRPLFWIDKASEHKCSIMYSPNFGLQYLVTSLRNKQHSWDLSSVRLLYNGAEPIIDRITTSFFTALKPYGLALDAMYPVYGMAEATVAISFPRTSDDYATYVLDRSDTNGGDKVQLVENIDAPNTVKFVRVGRPLDHCDVRICDDQDGPLDDNTIGNIQVKGGNVISGYYRDESLTRTLFTDDGWMRTGDVGFMTNGHVVITARKKNIIIINGQNYYPQDIESVLADVAGIPYGDIAACGIPDAGGAETLVIFVVFKGSPEDFQRAQKSISEKVFKQFGLMVTEIVPVRKFPKTTSGKLQYFKLKEEHLLANRTTHQDHPRILTP